MAETPEVQVANYATRKMQDGDFAPSTWGPQWVRLDNGRIAYMCIAASLEDAEVSVRAIARIVDGPNARESAMSERDVRRVDLALEGIDCIAFMISEKESKSVTDKIAQSVCDTARSIVAISMGGGIVKLSDDTS